MYNVMIYRVRIFVQDGWALEWILPRAGFPSLKIRFKLEKMQNTARIGLNKISCIGR